MYSLRIINLPVQLVFF